MYPPNPRQTGIIDNIQVPDKESTFDITIEEAKALNYFLKLHNGLLKQSPDEYTQLLRLINGLGTFLDKHDQNNKNS